MFSHKTIGVIIEATIVVTGEGIVVVLVVRIIVVVLVARIIVVVMVVRITVVVLVVRIIHIAGLQDVLRTVVARIIHHDTHPMVGDLGGIDLGPCLILRMLVDLGNVVSLFLIYGREEEFHELFKTETIGVYLWCMCLLSDYRFVPYY